MTMENNNTFLEEVRQAFADYYKSEGCACCRNEEAHQKAEQRLAELLKPDEYEDGSGFDWHKYCTDKIEETDRQADNREVKANQC